ncbi:MAG: MFS transporter [Dehalococcoidia bacterium]
MRLFPRDLFYGWYVVAATLVALSLGSGFTFWSFSVYIPPLEDEFGWSRGEVSLAFSLGLIASGIFAPFGGRAVDKLGARRVIALGSIGVFVTFLMLSQVQNLWQFYAVYALQAAIQSWSFYLPFQWLIAQWFERRRGTALGIATAGFGVGGSVVFPIVALAIDLFGWRGAYIMSGIVTVVAFIPLSLFLIRNRPSEMGLLPDGETAEEVEARPPLAEAVRDWTLGEAVRAPLFWFMALPMVLFFSALISFGVHSVPFFEDRGFSVGEAALFLALAAVFRTFGRAGAGFIIDRVDNLMWVAVPVMLIHCAVLAVLTLTTSTFGIIFFIVGWGLGGSFGPILTPILVGRTFGMKSYGGILGALLFIETLGDVAMPVAGGYIFDATGSYTIPFTIYACMFAASAFAYALFFISAGAHNRRLEREKSAEGAAVGSGIV